MRFSSFFILTALALLYVVLTVAETAMYQTWDHATAQQRDIQNKVAYFQRLNGFLGQLVRRMAVDSLHDPALTQVLKEHRIKVVQTGGEALNLPQDSTAVPAPAGKPATPPEINPPAPTPTTAHP